MLVYGTTISTIIERSYRRIKTRLFGTSDVRTAAQVSPFGEDSNPPKGFTAVYGNTAKDGKQVILGYLNTSLLAEVGEKRMFSVKANGDVSTFIWLKADETMQLGGDAHFAVRFTPLDSALQDLKTKINVELTKIQVGITGLGGAYSKVDVSIDISAAKNNKIKTI